MLYQLPNGKTINLSIEEFLNLTDQDIQDLVALNFGDYISSPWADSAIKNPNKHNKSEDIDKSIDFTADSDEIVIQSTTFVIITVDDIDSSDVIEDTGSEELEDT